MEFKDRYYKPKEVKFSERYTCLTCGNKYSDQHKTPNGYCKKCKRLNQGA